jgi:hypothetical protein
MPQTQDEIVRIFKQVTAQAQADADYKAKYLADPDSTLTDAGLEMPPNTSFRVQVVGSADDHKEYELEDDGKTVLVLPDVEEHIGDESLATAAAASCDSTASTCSTVCTCVSSSSSKSTNSCS